MPSSTLTAANVDLSTSIAAVPFAGYVMNASGPRCTTKEELLELSASDSAGIVTKSCTLQSREGNPKPRWKALPLGGIQSMGLPNLGYKAYLDLLPELREKTPDDKPIIVSISGLRLGDNTRMIEEFMESPASLLEVNVSCPNISGKPIVGYDMDQLQEVLRRFSEIPGFKPMGLKLPPYFDPCFFDTVVDIVTMHPRIRFVSTINSIGNCLVVDPETETPVIKPKGGLGGLCGSYVKPVGLANVRCFKERLGDDVQIIGVGGISTGTDAWEYMLAGADAVQVGTTLQTEGVCCFKRINEELRTLMAEKGYPTVATAKGKLQQL